MRKAIASDSHPTVRELAADILLKVETRKAYVDVLLDHARKTAALSAQDRALLTELCYGSVRWRGRLDNYLQKFITRPLAETDPFIRNVLRLAFYQFLFLDRVPEYAAVNEAVQVVKDQKGKKAAGFVNGVLRNFLRDKTPPANPDFELTPISGLAEYWSHPEWLVKRWLKYFGREETEALLQANNKEAPLVLRTNERDRTRDALIELFRRGELDALPTSWSPQGIIVRSSVSVDQIPGFQEGWFQVQGEASQLVAYLLDPKPGERILDTCAAPGGKTTHIAELTNDTGDIIASDISARGLNKIEENVERLKFRSIRTLKADLSKPLDELLSQSFDRVLVDAPCSGLGTLRSHPEIKWNRGEADIRRLADLQKTILARAASYLRPGGVLVYSTCTLSDDENESVVENFLECHRGFVLDAAAEYLPAQAKTMVRGKYFLALPHRHETDGFFAARMRRLS